jgi:hypothetical protein
VYRLPQLDWHKVSGDGDSKAISITLDDLQVAGAKTALNPGFDPAVLCYSVIANDPPRLDLTRVVEYRIDEQALEAELVWSYTQENAYSTAQGSAQRLANGNTLIGWGAGPEVIATEVRSDGTKVFELRAADPNETVDTYRAFRFPQ